MKIKIIKNDGTKAEIEIDGVIDFQGMGVLSPDEVTGLKTRALKEGEDKATRLLQEKIDAAEKKLADYEASLSDKQKTTVKAEERIATMEATIKALRDEMLEAQRVRAEAEMARTLADARSNLAFVDGGQEVFDMAMNAKRQPDGTYILSTGERGTLDQARAEWVGSAVGKAMIKAANQANGTGTTPGISGKTFADVMADKTGKLKLEYVKQHGEARYTADYLAWKKGQQK